MLVSQVLESILSTVCLFRKAGAQAWFSRINMQQSIYSIAVPLAQTSFLKNQYCWSPRGTGAKPLKKQSLSPTGDRNTLIFVQKQQSTNWYLIFQECLVYRCREIEAMLEYWLSPSISIYLPGKHFASTGSWDQGLLLAPLVFWYATGTLRQPNRMVLSILSKRRSA